MPFLRNVTRGRGVPEPSGWRRSAEHYFHFGGVSPINDQNRALLDALRSDFAAHGLDLPDLLGQPQLGPVPGRHAAQMARDGVRRALALRHHRLRLLLRLPAVPREPRRGPRRGRPGRSATVDKLRHYFNHPGFIGPRSSGVLAALAAPAGGAARRRRPGLHHALDPDRAWPTSAGPRRRARTTAQHLEVARLVADGVAAATGRTHPWELVYQSRCGPPNVPWLEPDISDHLEELARRRGAGGRRGPDRVRLRPHGGQLRPRHRGRAKAAELGLRVRPGRHRGHRPARSSRRSATRAGARRASGAAPARRSGRSGRATTCARPAAARTCARPSPPWPAAGGRRPSRGAARRSPTTHRPRGRAAARRGPRRLGAGDAAPFVLQEPARPTSSPRWTTPPRS